MTEEIPHTFGNSPLNVVLVSITVLAESISKFGFRFWYRTKTKLVVSVVH